MCGFVGITAAAPATLKEGQWATGVQQEMRNSSGINNSSSTVLWDVCKVEYQ